MSVKSNNNNNKQEQQQENKTNSRKQFVRLKGKVFSSKMYYRSYFVASFFECVVSD